MGGNDGLVALLSIHITLGFHRGKYAEALGTLGTKAGVVQKIQYFRIALE